MDTVAELWGTGAFLRFLSVSRGDDLAGIAVHIGARVAARAHAGEVLVTSTVRDLVAGSGIMFTDRGEHALAGVPDPWRLLAVGV